MSRRTGVSHALNPPATTAADQAPQDIPARDVAALDVAGPEYEISLAGAQRLKERRQEPDRMAEVGVHLDDDVRLTGNKVLECRHVGSPEALLGRAVKDGNGRLCLCHLVGQLPRAVWRAVIDDQDVGVRDDAGDGVGYGADVLALVVGRNDYPDA